MQKNIKHIAFSLMLFLSLFGSFLIGRHSRVANEPIVVTKVIRDTIMFYMPPEIEHRVIRDTIAIHDTTFCKDTIFLPREQKVYADSSYRAVVSGVSPRLDSIFVYPKTIYETRFATQNEWRRITFGLQVGVGGVIPLFSSSDPSLGAYIGVGLGFRF